VPLIVDRTSGWLGVKKFPPGFTSASERQVR
jgi:hypothetical protein